MGESELPEIDRNFINENSNLCNLRQKSSAPHNKKERLLRRQEVFRLHFDQGIPATKIAEMLNVNRNTVQADIQYVWSRLSKEWEHLSVSNIIMRQIKRLESQRSRLISYLEKEQDNESKLSIERLILDVDNRISQIFVNAKHSSDRMIDGSMKLLNQWARKSNLGKLFLRNTDLTYVDESDYEDINERLAKSRAKIRNKGIPIE